MKDLGSGKRWSNFCFISTAYQIAQVSYSWKFSRLVCRSKYTNWSVLRFHDPWSMLKNPLKLCFQIFRFIKELWPTFFFLEERRTYFFFLRLPTFYFCSILSLLYWRPLILSNTHDSATQTSRFLFPPLSFYFIHNPIISFSFLSLPSLCQYFSISVFVPSPLTLLQAQSHHFFFF